MKINSFLVTNWKPVDGEKNQGETFWNNIREYPEDPLINLRLHLTLSWNEYQEIGKKLLEMEPESNWTYLAAWLDEGKK